MQLKPSLQEYARLLGIAALWIAVALGVAGLCGSLIESSRRDAKSGAVVAAANLTHAIADGIGKDLQSYDRSLREIISGLHDPALNNLDPAARKKYLFKVLTSSPYIDDAFVLDRQGALVADARGFLLSDRNFSRRKFFAALSRADGLGLYFGKPFLSPSEGDDWVLVFGRRISGPDDAFEGVVGATLSLGYFESLFDNFKSNPSDVFSIFRMDGSVIMQQPFRRQNMGRVLLSQATLKKAAARESFTEKKIARTDGVQRIYSYSRVQNLPLLVAAGLGKAEIFAPWKTKAEAIGAMGAGLVLAMTGMGWLLARELMRRRAAERRLTALAMQLTVDARTDPLTGLANRRAFDEISAREWSRVIAESGTISLLVIDIDHFKRFNDRYGHRRGDEALIAVARRIESELNHPLEIAARHGGEEFVVLLPDIDLCGARQIAESIRRSVARQSLGHGASVTVSTGMACVKPKEGDLFLEAFTAADAALYRAKERGRNCTWISSAADPDPAGLSLARIQSS